MPRRPLPVILERPTKNSIELGGKHINLSAISRQQGLKLSYVSQIVNGIRTNPRLEILQKICSAIGMGIDEFLVAIEDRLALKKTQADATILQYKKRKRNMRLTSARRKASGVPEIKPLPGTYLTKG